MRHGSQIDPPNRFATIHLERSFDDVEDDDQYLSSIGNRSILYLEDQSQSIVSTNRSPDIPFNYSLNPYRGCAHACAYCYARPTHEYLGFNGGLDFETRIIVKRQAGELLRQFLARPQWKVEPIAFSGVTDCYQPAERHFGLTRDCLQVAWRYKQPLSIVTKNALVLRDVEILSQLAEHNLVHVFLSITTLVPELALRMEPRTSIPQARLRAITELTAAGIPTGVMVAPIIPGLNDAEIPSILAAAKQAGAQTAGTVVLRLPSTVQPVFEEWLQRNYPDKFELVMGRIRQCREGGLNQSQFGRRMTGTGLLAEQIRQLFKVFQKKEGLDQPLPAFNCSEFVHPEPNPRQLRLF